MVFSDMNLGTIVARSSSAPVGRPVVLAGTV